MRLLSATVRSYRVHRDLTVEFDPARTLIGALNETGKSTLIEAIHRGLFLKATVTGEARARMESTCSSGHPEVEVCFEAKGAQYQVTKRFSGQSGTTRLVQVSGPTWLGEEAQSRLNELLGVGEVGGGRGMDGRVSEQWAHLWVWQGKSLDDPSEHVAAQQADLLLQLQQVGGAVAMQSELDGRVASRLSEARGLIYTSTGSVRRNSDLDRAQIELAQAKEERTAAAARVEKLRQAAEEFEAARTVVERASHDREELSGRLRNVEAEIGRVEELRRSEEKQISDVGGAADRLAALETVEKSIAELRDSIGGVRESLEPREEAQGRLEAGLAEVRKSREQTEQSYEKALEATRDAQRRRDLAAAFVTRLEKQARCDKLDGHLETVRELEKELAGIREELARLVPLSREGLEALQALEGTAAQAASALNAMATEVEVVAADVPVVVGDTELPSGGRRTVSDLAEVTVGDSVRLRIHPGGGDRLAEAREAVRRLRDDLRRDLDAYGLASVAEAVKMNASRTELLSKEASVVAALEQWPAGLSGLGEERRVAGEELAAADAEVQRRGEQLADVLVPTTMAEARTRLEGEEEKLRSVDSRTTGLKAELDALRVRVTESETAFNEACGSIDDDKRRLVQLSSQLELLIGTHGEHEARAQMIQDAHKTKGQLEVELSETQAALSALQPELLVADRERLGRALEQTETQRQDAQNKRAATQALLRSDGTDDPVGALAEAEAWVESATRWLETVERKARAIALVDDLFQEEQHALADRFSRPLAEKIGGYLQCLFGQEAQAVVSFEDNHFKRIELARPSEGGATAFARLSGGAREQVAAAVRLAIAELLAADHDGCLPVVFDDAFAYSDPERVNTLQRMLDLGAARGLQIIVLTCNPSDYAALGARQVTLRQPAGS